MKNFFIALYHRFFTKSISTTMKYSELLSLDLEFQTLAKQNPGLALINQSKIREFYKNNSVRLNSLKDRIKELNQKYRQCDKHGNAFSYEDSQQPVMLEGKSFADYRKEMTALLEQEAHILI